MIQHGRSRRTYPQGPAVSHTFITWHKCICICLFLCHPCFVSPSLFDPRPMSSQYHSTFRTAQFQYTSHSTIACLICMYATFSINKLKRLNGHVPFSLSLSPPFRSSRVLPCPRGPNDLCYISLLDFFPIHAIFAALPLHQIPRFRAYSAIPHRALFPS